MQKHKNNTLPTLEIDSAKRLIDALFDQGDALLLEAGEASEVVRAEDADALKTFVEQSKGTPISVSAANKAICWVMGWAPKGFKPDQSSIEPTVCLAQGEAVLMVYRLDQSIANTASTKKVRRSLSEICERNGAQLGEAVPLGELADWRIVSLNPKRRYSPETLDRLLCVMGEAGPEPLVYSKGSGMICGTGLSLIEDIQNEGPDPELAITEFSGSKAKLGKLRKLRMSELFEHGCVFRMSKQKDGPAWVFGELAENTRQASAVTKVSALALDFDTGVEIELIDAAVERLGITALR